MAVEHAGTGVSHHGPDFLSHLRFIAVQGTCRTLRLVVPKGAMFKAFVGVVEESAIKSLRILLFFC